ncbi:MAG: 50S ribosomal protein L6 [Anaerolineales bacterium]|nr:50S ribosomal protein L6 [Anaerolineales bacterium]MCB9145524.1 50S ribosomal protein L6 [Anaerolineales bacterium]
MSRIGRLPVDIPSGVQVELNGSKVRVKGPKGELSRVFSSLIDIKMEDNQLKIARNSDNSEERALHGTTRAVLANMIHGVSKGFEVILEVEGVGYRAEMEGKNLTLFVGYSHPVKIEPPAGVTFETDAKTRQIKVQGFDKELVGQVAANIRKVRPPEPYHGKGLRYLGEKVRRKAGKAGKGAK